MNDESELAALRARLFALGYVSLQDDGRIILMEDALVSIKAIVEECANSPRVTGVYVHGGDKCRDSHIEFLKNLKYLSALELSSCDRITDEALLHISKMTALKSLDLSGVQTTKFKITAVGLKLLSRLNQLELLKLPTCFYDSHGKQAVISHLKGSLPNTIIA